MKTPDCGNLYGIFLKKSLNNQKKQLKVIKKGLQLLLILIIFGINSFCQTTDILNKVAEQSAENKVKKAIIFKYVQKKEKFPF